MPSIAQECKNCQQYAQVNVAWGQPLVCSHCLSKWGEAILSGFSFEQCPLCQCKQFYLQKDFNQALGCVIMLVGIILVPWTYGLSLPFFALVDWLLYRKIPTIVVCYRCGAEFRGFNVPQRFKKFMHQIGVKYDEKRKKPG